MAVLAVVMALTAIACGSDEDGSAEPSPRFLRMRNAADLPAEPAAAESRLRARPQVERARCASRRRFIDHALGAHGGLDLVALPDRACVVEFGNGGTVDFFRIRDRWFRIGRYLEP